MDAIREKSKNPWFALIIGLIIGAIFGLVVLGWWLWPVQWTNATPEYLSAEWQEEYLRMAIEAFGQNGNALKAQERYTALGSSAPDVLASIVQSPEDLSNELIMSFTEAVATVTIPVEEEEGPNWLYIIIAILCILGLIVIAFLVYFLVFRGKKAVSGEPTPAMQAEEAKRQAAWTDYSTTGAEPPLAQFMASYKIGDDLFDDSFSIDSASGEFLGECGVGISEPIGVGEPKKVTAFEVWLFDKNDIQTVTKVIMSSHAFYDSTIRQRLESKGEPVLAEPGIETVLETQTLQLVARVVDMSYGEGGLPSQSFFDHLILELAVWPK